MRVKFKYTLIVILLLLSEFFIGCTINKKNLAASPSVAFDQEEAESYLATLPKKNNAIDLQQLTIVPGGGTHDIYKFGEESQFFLKVMKQTIGKNVEVLAKDLTELTSNYKELYKVFGFSKCLVERRFIMQVYMPGQSKEENAIVSVVRFEPAFQNKEKFGFNIGVIESDKIKINTNLSEYHSMNLGLMGSKIFEKSFDLENFLIFEDSFRKIFNMLDKNESLREAMKDFLHRFKVYYEKTNRLMDLRGRDNVFFYKSESGWKYKVGSVIKTETGKGMRKMITKISTNPESVNESFPNWTLIFYAPSWVRGLNATAKKLEMDRVIENITFSKEDSENLAKIHTVLP
jgi:hypothetical protein